MRTSVKLDSTFKINLFGHSNIVRGPASSQELRSQGFRVFSHDHFSSRGYVEDKDPFGWASRLLTQTRAGSHTLLQGPPGTGKNLTADYMAFRLNRPYVTFSMKEEGGMVADWLGRTVLEPQDGLTVSKDLKGALRRAAEGCRIMRDGKEQILPAIICFSDVDRANPKQVDILREALEVGKGQLFNPLTGEMYDICPGTVFVFTSNRGLDSDGGTGMLTNPIDASIGNRFRGVKVPKPTEAWEKDVVKRSNPDLPSNVINMIVKGCRALRTEAETAYMDVLQISVRDMVDAAREYPIALEIMGDPVLAVRFCLEGTIEKMTEEPSLEALRSSLVSICGELRKPSDTPFDS